MIPKQVGEAISFIIVGFFVSIPLALWKIGDILFWLINHVEIGIK